MSITPGDHYTKNGIEFTVHCIENGEVYGVRYREGTDDDELLKKGIIPEGCLGACRVTLEIFEREIVGAVHKHETEAAHA